MIKGFSTAGENNASSFPSDIRRSLNLCYIRTGFGPARRRPGFLVEFRECD
jgi:hypothetical protein